MFFKDIWKMSNKDPNITLMYFSGQEWNTTLAIDIILYALEIQTDLHLIL